MARFFGIIGGDWLYGGDPLYFWNIRVGLFISQEFRILAFKFWSFLFKLPVYWDMGCE
jgi:hypothetical protein